jgi:DNA-binding transcriptional LysR family regulator
LIFETVYNMSMGLELRHLRAFLAVVRHGTVSRAAVALRLTQPSVSMTLGELARELGGVRPFERHGRGLRLTAAGQALLKRAGPLLEELERLPVAVQEAVAGAPRGPVRVGAGEAAVLYLLPGPIRAFRARFPDVDVIVRNQSGEDTAAMLRAGELDFGLRGWETAPRGLDYRPVLRFDRVLVAPPRHPVLRVRPLTLAAVAKYPLVLPWPRSTLRRKLELALEQARLPYRVVLEAGGWEVVKRYVALGLGIGIVPAFCIQRGDRLGKRVVTDLFGSEVYGIATRLGRPLSPAATELANLMVAGGTVSRRGRADES